MNWKKIKDSLNPINFAINLEKPYRRTFSGEYCYLLRQGRVKVTLKCYDCNSFVRALLIVFLWVHINIPSEIFGFLLFDKV